MKINMLKISLVVLATIIASAFVYLAPASVRASDFSDQVETDERFEIAQNFKKQKKNFKKNKGNSGNKKKFKNKASSKERNKAKKLKNRNPKNAKQQWKNPNTRQKVKDVKKPIKQEWQRLDVPQKKIKDIAPKQWKGEGKQIENIKKAPNDRVREALNKRPEQKKEVIKDKLKRANDVRPVKKAIKNKKVKKTRFKDMRKKYKDASPEKRKEMISNLKKNNPKAYEKMKRIREQKQKLGGIKDKREKAKRLSNLKKDFSLKSSERKQKFLTRWEKAKPEDKAKFCTTAKERCSMTGSKAKVCGFTTNMCKGI